MSYITVYSIISMAVFVLFAVAFLFIYISYRTSRLALYFFCVLMATMVNIACDLIAGFIPGNATEALAGTSYILTGLIILRIDNHLNPKIYKLYILAPILAGVYLLFWTLGSTLELIFPIDAKHIIFILMLIFHASSIAHMVYRQAQRTRRSRRLIQLLILFLYIVYFSVPILAMINNAYELLIGSEPFGFSLVIVIFIINIVGLGIAWMLLLISDYIRLLKEKSNKDSLTKISNRGHFFETGELMIDQCNREGSGICMILFDIDNFKLINDTYGHQTGDRVLQHIVQVVQDNLSPNMLFGRLGGEEFGLIITKGDTSSSFIQDLCKTLSASVFTTTTGITFHVTASFGVVCSHGDHWTLDQLVKQADDAMYNAKRAGKNRVIVVEI